MKKESQQYERTGKTNEEIMVKVIGALRKNPEKWQRLRKSLRSAKSDDQRAKQLIKFATDERELAALMPLTAAGVELAAWTTVTVTTIFILEDSAY